MDVRTLLIVNAALTAFMALTMIFYRKTRKVYPGFNEWTVCIVFETLVTFLIGLRGIIPDFFSIVIALTLASLIALLRYTGTRKYMELPVCLKMLIPVPVVMFFSAAYFTYIQNDAVARNTMFSGAIILLGGLNAIDLIFKCPKNNCTLYRITGIMIFYYIMMTAYRMVYWYLHPTGSPFDNSVIHTVFFFSTLLCTSGWNMCFLMMNSLRLELELRSTETHLNETVSDLQTALSEVKELSGLLPICSCCNKIRDDKGYWQRLEHYFMKYSNTQFTHSLCPACMQKKYTQYSEAHPSNNLTEQNR